MTAAFDWIGSIALGFSIGYAAFNELRRFLSSRPRVETTAWLDEGRVTIKVEVTNTRSGTVTFETASLLGFDGGHVSYSFGRPPPRHELQAEAGGGFMAILRRRVEPGEKAEIQFHAVPLGEPPTDAEVSVVATCQHPIAWKWTLRRTATVVDAALVPE